MKNCNLIVLFLAVLGSLMASSGLVFTCDGYKTTFRQDLKDEEIPSLRNRMESLIKTGHIPVVIEEENNVVWLYLNDPYGGRGYPEINFESDYFEIIQDLFPLKLTNRLKRSLKRGNKSFVKTLGIEYIVENDEVISRINYDTFEKFIF